MSKGRVNLNGICAWKKTLTVDKLLLLVGGDAGEVSPLEPTLSLCHVPVPPLRDILVAVALELVPAIVTHIRICGERAQGFRPYAWTGIRTLP